MKAKVIAILLLGLPLLKGCSLELSTTQASSVSIVFSTPQSQAKSSFGWDEQRVESLGIYAYRNGLLEQQGYSDSESQVELSLLTGCSYNFYGLANCPEQSLPLHESELSSWRMSLQGQGVEPKAIPMSWEMKNHSFRASETFLVQLSRLFAKLSFGVDKDLSQELSIASIRLKNIPSSIAPFAQGGSRAVEGATCEGDYADSTDIARINNGGEIVLYVPENRQGDLLPSNTNPMQKLPDNIGPQANVCTYLEVGCNFSSSRVLSGDVTYRFYIGRDNCSNFDLVRNGDYDVLLCLTDDGLEEISWRVTANIHYREGLINCSITQGTRKTGELYIGEILKCRLDPLEELLQDFGNDGFLDCSIGLTDGANGILDNVECGPIYKEGGQYYCDIKAAKLLGEQKSLALYDTRGRYMSGDGGGLSLVVKKGRLYPSTRSVRVIMNEYPASVDFYLLDDDGLNINCSAAYDFDIQMYSGCSVVASADDDIGDYSSAIEEQLSRVVLGTKKSDGPLATAQVRISDEDLDDYSDVSSTLNNVLDGIVNIGFELHCPNAINSETVGIELWESGSEPPAEQRRHSVVITHGGRLSFTSCEDGDDVTYDPSFPQENWEREDIFTNDSYESWSLSNFDGSALTIDVYAIGSRYNSAQGLHYSGNTATHSFSCTNFGNGRESMIYRHEQFSASGSTYRFSPNIGLLEMSGNIVRGHWAGGQYVILVTAVDGNPVDLEINDNLTITDEFGGSWRSWFNYCGIDARVEQERFALKTTGFMGPYSLSGIAAIETAQSTALSGGNSYAVYILGGS